MQNTQKKSKIKHLKHKFDYITSQNSQNWKLVLCWIIIVELIASAFEYLYFDNTIEFIELYPDTLAKQLIIAIVITSFVWYCVYNIIFFNKTNLFLLFLFATFGLYLIVTNDLTFNFLLHNLEPMHFLRANLSIELMIELFFKLIITYLLYQLIISIKNNKKTS